MRPSFEVADIFRRHGDAYRAAHGAHMGRVERRIMGAIEACRTAVLGGHVEACDNCAHTRVAYNSCRNRHCPKCQGLTRAEWLADRQADLLEVPYFHVVFTLPAEVAAVAFQNKAVVYAMLFRAAAETLRTIAADPRHLGAEIGFIAILHTWGQTLTHHPHLHCVVPGGGLAPIHSDDERWRWIACRPRFFLPVHVLSRLYRRLFLEQLQAAFDAGRLTFFGELAGLAEAPAFATRLKALRKVNWFVYAKPPFGSPEQVLAYLGRYTHRVAIANSRLVAIDGTRVRLQWRDYRQHNKAKVMTLDAPEFIRRFLLHSLPDGFHRIRHYGFLANGHRVAKLALVRRLLDQNPPEKIRRGGDYRQRLRDLMGIDLGRCPCCGGAMHIIDILPRPRSPPDPPSGWCRS
ncbi:MAG: IS91 family transposase [Proteobacteria bacterium]|nr:IS91 family transposase [Pseudomonadota bacterium]